MYDIYGVLYDNFIDIFTWLVTLVRRVYIIFKHNVLLFYDKIITFCYKFGQKIRA
jgi:hypothetical protein